MADMCCVVDTNVYITSGACVCVTNCVNVNAYGYAGTHVVDAGNAADSDDDNTVDVVCVEDRVNGYAATYALLCL